MNQQQYDQYSRDLRQHVATRSEVLGLIALGSMSGVGTPPDQWSDHDFFLIVQDGHEETFRQQLDWLPDQTEILFSIRETEHGLKVLYRHTHLVEFAVFTLEQLKLARINRYSILFSRVELDSILARLAQESAPRPDDPDSQLRRLVGLFLCQILIGVGRFLRGEHLSAHIFVKNHVLQLAMALVRLAVPSQPESRPDNLDQSRRFEVAFPHLGRAFEQALLLPVPECAAQWLSLVRSILPAHVAVAYTEAFDTIDRRLASPH